MFLIISTHISLHDIMKCILYSSLPINMPVLWMKIKFETQKITSHANLKQYFKAMFF